MPDRSSRMLLTLMRVTRSIDSIKEKQSTVNPFGRGQKELAFCLFNDIGRDYGVGHSRFALIAYPSCQTKLVFGRKILDGPYRGAGDRVEATRSVREDVNFITIGLATFGGGGTPNRTR
jgi:hypothetical protein